MVGIPRIGRKLLSFSTAEQTCKATQLPHEQADQRSEATESHILLWKAIEGAAHSLTNKTAWSVPSLNSPRIRDTRNQPGCGLWALFGDLLWQMEK